MAAKIAGEVFTLNYIPVREKDAAGERPSMRRAMDETERRRKKQDAFNRAHGIVPRTIRKSVREMVEISHTAEEASKKSKRKLSDAERQETIRRLEKEMQAASKMLEFEYAALLRDQIIELRKQG